jgi:hypothetical protein
MNYTKHTLQTTDCDVRYHLFQASQMDVVRLRSDIHAAAADFSSFYEASDRAPTAIFCASADLCGLADVPEFMCIDETGRRRFLTVRAALSHWSGHYIATSYEGQPVGPVGCEAANVIGQWIADRKVALQVPGKYVGGRLERLVVGDLGHVSSLAQRYDVVTASGYSVIDNEECLLPFQSIRDPIGFRATGGMVSSAPLYGRPVLMHDGDRFEIARLDLLDIEVDVPALGLACISTRSSNASLFGRQDGSFTREEGTAIDLVVVEDRIVAVCKGGGTPAPKAGFIIRSSTEVVNDKACRAIEEDNRVVIRVPTRPNLIAGIQCGPHLMERGRVLEQERQLRDERFMVAKRDPEAIPVGLQDSVGSLRAARTIALVRNDGTMAVLVIEGTASGIANGRETAAVSAFGATFAETVEIARRGDAACAMALDSGGSVSLYVRGDKAIDNGDYRRTNLRHERPLAHALAFH